MQGMVLRVLQFPAVAPSLRTKPVLFLPRAFTGARNAPCLPSSSICFASSPHLQNRARFELVDDGEDDEDDQSDRPHIPVLLDKVLAGFRNTHLQTFVDCTLGAGGHASAIIGDHLEMKTFVGLDVDPIAHSMASPRLQDAVMHRRTTSENASNVDLHLFQTNFRNMKSVVEQLGLAEHGVDGIMMDLGMSSMQLNVAERGFSLQQDGPLDMRMDPLLTLSADDILNDWPESEIGRILREYGDEMQWKRIAHKISELQLAGGIHSTFQLLEIIKKSLPTKFSAGRPGWKKTAIRVFQALRIAVNDELGALETALSDAYACLGSNGRLAVISFQSLEDRIVKQFFLKVMGKNKSVDGVANGDSDVPFQTKRSKYMKRSGVEDDKQMGDVRNKILEGKNAIILTKKPVVAGIDEIKQNKKARSAKLRILEKK